MGENCLFKDDNNYWCISSTSPVMTIGWEWDQDSGSNDDEMVNWSIGLVNFVETELSIASDFYLQKLITATTEMALDSFSTGVYT